MYAIEAKTRPMKCPPQSMKQVPHGGEFSFTVLQNISIILELQMIKYDLSHNKMILSFSHIKE